MAFDKSRRTRDPLQVAEAAFKAATTKPPEEPAPKRPSIPNAKELVSLRIDRDVLDHFQEKGCREVIPLSVIVLDRSTLARTARPRTFQRRSGRCVQAARSVDVRRCPAPTSTSAATSASMCSSEWYGVGVIRSRSCPRGTVG